MRNFFETKWYSLPVLSAILLVASFYPFNIWILVPVALTPLYYFATLYDRFGRKKVFLGAMLTGSLFAFSLAYMSVIQFHWMSQAYIFEYAIRLSFIPITIVSASVCGISILTYGLARKKLFESGAHRMANQLSAVFLGAALYTVSEVLLSALFKGYYFGTLGYALHEVSPIVSLASIGGVFFVSFLVALISTSLVEALHGDRRPVMAIALGILCLVAIDQNHIAVSRQSATDGEGPSLSIALIQNNSRSEGLFGISDGTSFSIEGVGELLEEASESSPDLIIYPFSPVNGAIYREGTEAYFNKDILVASDKVLGAWIASHVPRDTVVMTWTTMYDSGVFSNEILYWRNGEIVSEYKKRRLFPFMDYTPSFAQRIGLFSTPIDVAAGAEDQEPFFINDVAVNNTICSEINDQSLGRTDARDGLITINAGSEAMFVDDAVSEFNFASSQYRAAENGMTLIRANKFGPSGVIDAHGKVLAGTTFNENRILTYDVTPRKHDATIFNRTGNIPLYALLIISLVTPLFLIKRRGLKI